MSVSSASKPDAYIVFLYLLYLQINIRITPNVYSKSKIAIIEKTLMKTQDELRSLLKTEFQRKLFDAALQSAHDFGNGLRLNNFSTGIRELVREVLDFLAPNEEIKSCDWFVHDTSSSTGVTRGHRASYVIHGGIDANYAKDQLCIDVEFEVKRLVGLIKTLSKFTHVTDSTFDMPAGEVDRHVENACIALKGLLATANEARHNLSEAIRDQVEETVIRTAISETILSIDEIATHHYIDEIQMEEIEVTDIGSNEIKFLAHGSVGVELQWGSNSDVRNDIGAIMGESFPFTMKFISSVKSPSKICPLEDSFSVDTSDWFDD